VTSTADRTAAVAERGARDYVRAAQLVDADVNALSDRAAMGLPAGYVRPGGERLDLAGALTREPAELLAVLQDPELPLDRRLAAGALLALAGDPRTVATDPVLVDVPAGAAWVGTEDADVDALHAESEAFGVRRNWIEKECPRHRAPVAAFRLGAYPVTNAEFAEFLIATGYEELPTSWGYGRFHPAQANHPVYTVTAAAADAYVGWLAATTGRPFRLPTEYEWEYAAGGPAGRRYPWGDDWADGLANTLEEGILASTPIGAYPGGLSWCGAYDLAGNVEEYVSDVYQPYPGGQLVEDDLYRRAGHYRIARGGAFNRFRDLARNQRRHGPYPRSLYAMGFRVAEDTS